MVKNLLLMVENICVDSTTSKELKLFPLISLVKKAITPLLNESNVNWSKSDATPVSNTDILIQDFLIKLITTKYPNDNLLFEEGEQNSIKKSSNYTWIIDPIDGTQNLIEGKKEYSISIGIMYGNEFIESFVYFPAYNIDLYAIKEKGVWINGEKKISDLGNSKSNSIILCSKTVNSLGPTFQSLGYEIKFYRCATYSVLQVLMQNSLFYHTINTMLYDVGPMAHILSEYGMNSYNGLLENIQFTPSLERIPFFISANSKFHFNSELKKSLKIQI